MMGTTLISCRAGVYDGRREALTRNPFRLEDSARRALLGQIKTRRR